MAQPWLSHNPATQGNDGLNTRIDTDDDDGDDAPGIFDPQLLKPVRTEFTGGSTIVHGCPSTRGVWVKPDCYALEIDFLGVPRFEPAATQRETAPVAEDKFCQRLEWIGAKFYESDFAYTGQIWEEDQSDSTEWWFAWPGPVPDGGVWALQAGRLRAAEMGVSRIRNARTMEERCQAVEMLGGKFYEKWEDVPAMRSKDGHERAEL